MDSLLPVAQDELLRIYARRIRSIAGTIRNRMRWVEMADLVQWGAIAMLEARELYQPSSGVPFEAFALKRIRGAMIDNAGEDLRRRQSETVLDLERIEINAFEDGNLPDDPMKQLLGVEDQSLVVGALTDLRAESYQEYRILAMHFFHDVNNREIAKILGVSEGYATKLRKSAIERLAVLLKAKTEGAVV